MARDLATLVASTPELAAMPATSSRLLQALEDPDAPVDELVTIIEKDPGLTANLLKLSNSAYYGLRRSVGSVREALVLMGNRTVVTLAFAASMGRLLQVPVTAYRLPRGQLWRHALATGLLAARLAPADAGTSLRNRIFTAGVVHDIGKLLLDRPLRETLEQLPPDLDYDGLVAAERKLLGFDHARAGAALAEAWNFPEDLVEVIASHHDAAPTGSIPAMIHAADLMVSQHGHHGGAAVVGEGSLERALEAAGLSAEEGQEVGGQAVRDLDGMLALLGVDG
jgi:putative nucleotidyltransferase with HDIG domain